MSATKSESTSVLVFDWTGSPQGFDMRLLGCIGFSLLIHALSFYVFQIVYPPSATILNAPGRVTFLTPDSPQHAALLRWVETADPTLMTRPHPTDGAEQSGLPDYTPSFANSEPALQEIESRRVRSAPQDAGPVRIPRAGVAAASRASGAPAGRPSALRISGDLAKRKIRVQPVFDFKIKAVTALEPPVYLVAVTPAGDVNYAFLQTGSGSNETNQLCGEVLRRVKFEPGGRDLTWGFVTLEPGADLYEGGEEVK